MGILSLLLFLFGLISFFNKLRFITLMSLMVLAFNYFGFSSSDFSILSVSLQHSDLSLLLIFTVLPFCKNLNEKEVKYLKISLIIFLTFLMISILYDLIFRGTTPLQIFRTVRKTGFLFVFFLINSFSFKDFKKLLFFLISITLIHSIFYISQYIFNFSFSSNDLLETELGGSRYSNSPPFVTLLLAILLFKERKQTINYYQLSIVLMAILLTLSRGAIVSSLVVIIAFFVLKYEMKIYKLLIPFFILFLGIVISFQSLPILATRFSNTTKEILSINKMDYSNLIDFYHQGSLTFRLGVTYERLIHVLEDPVRILLGVGFIPDMDITQKIFVIGTKSDGLPTGFEQYNSGDILYPNIITRYGILGSLLFLSLIFKIFSFSNKNKKYKYGKILYVYLISMMLTSFNNQSFYQGQVFIIIFVMIGLVLIEKKKVQYSEYKPFNNL